MSTVWAFVKLKAPYIVGIAGGTASGKTWLCRYLKAALQDRVAVISQDWYYKCRLHVPQEERAKINFDHPEAFDGDLLAKHLSQIQAGEAVEVPQYDFVTHGRRSETHAIRPAEVLLVEGLYVLHDERLRRRFDYSVFVEVPADVRLIRRIRRDVGERGRTLEGILCQYENDVRPMHDAHLQATAAFAKRVWRPIEEREFPAEFSVWLKSRPAPAVCC